MQTRLSALGAVVFFFLGNIYAQTSPLELKHKQFDSQYGLNQMLFNGEKYSPEHTEVKGHPFLYSDEPVEGKLMLKGQVFEPVMLKYDIYKQQFVLSFLDRNKANQQLVIPNLSIDSVWISHALFTSAVPYNLLDGFVQVLEYGEYKILYRWSKAYQFTAAKNDMPHVYSDANRTSYFYHDELTVKFRSKGSFVKLLPIAKQKAIKNYLKRNKIRFNKVSDSDMIEILIYINTLN